jgi:hypothetical protein
VAEYGPFGEQENKNAAASNTNGRKYEYLMLIYKITKVGKLPYR